MAPREKKTKKIPLTDEEKKKISLLKEIVSFIAGEPNSKIVSILYGKQNVNEFDISKELNLTINQTRNILYKLSDEGVVSFIRKKDKKSGGWYTYFWTLNPGKSFTSLKNKLDKEINELENQLLTKKNKQFYFCENCGIEMSEEDALAYDFTCPECGEVFRLKDNSQSINAIENQISKLKANSQDVENELEQISKKEDATNIRKMKAEERKKKVEREIRKSKREKEKKKEERKKARKKTDIKAKRKPQSKAKKASKAKKSLKKSVKKKPKKLKKK